MADGFALVDKGDLSVVVALSTEQASAIRAVENGSGCERLRTIVLEVRKRAHGDRLWLGCDCRRDGGRRPVVACYRAPSHQ